MKIVARIITIACGIACIAFAVYARGLEHDSFFGDVLWGGTGSCVLVASIMLMTSKDRELLLFCIALPAVGVGLLILIHGLHLISCINDHDHVVLGFDLLMLFLLIPTAIIGYHELRKCR